jgi:hypothetical protein
MTSHGYARIVYDEIDSFMVGSIPVTIGKVFGKHHDNDSGVSAGPVIYGAATSEPRLDSEICGYGTSQAEAVADLFRMMR